MYSLDCGETFKFAKCVPVLHKLPKFDPMVGVGNDGRANAPSMDSSPGSEGHNFQHSGDSSVAFERRTQAKVNNSVPPQGSSMERPIGMKKAKLLKTLEEGAAKASTNQFLSRTAAAPIPSELIAAENAISEMSSATKELVAAFKVNTSLKRDEMRMKSHDKWMKMASMYMSCGKQDMALALLDKIQRDDEKESCPPSMLADEIGVPLPQMDETIADDTTSAMPPQDNIQDVSLTTACDNGGESMQPSLPQSPAEPSEDHQHL
jgi:hypothetical protein